MAEITTEQKVDIVNQFNSGIGIMCLYQAYQYQINIHDVVRWALTQTWIEKDGKLTLKEKKHGKRTLAK